jgi:hypothetical protein
MLSNFKKILIAGALMLAATLSVSTTAVAQTFTRTFTVVNHSRYQIDHLQVSLTGYNVSSNGDIIWGPDRLGRDVLPPNYRFDMSLFPAMYDVKLSDRYGNVCIVPSVDFRTSETLTITDGFLALCELVAGM